MDLAFLSACLKLVLRLCAMQAAENEQMAKIVDAARATEAGHKKDYSGEMPKAYDPKFVEAAVYACSSHSSHKVAVFAMISFVVRHMCCAFAWACNVRREAGRL